MSLPTTEHSLEIRQDQVATQAQQDLVKLGVARNSREEKARARDAVLKQELENRRMAALHREHVLGQMPAEPLIQVQRRRKPAGAEEKPAAIVDAQEPGSQARPPTARPHGTRGAEPALPDLTVAAGSSTSPEPRFVRATDTSPVRWMGRAEVRSAREETHAPIAR